MLTSSACFCCLAALYGHGYLLEVHTLDDPLQQAVVADFITQQLGGVEVDQRWFGCLRFRLPARGLAAAFRAVESRKESLCIDAYSLSQPTLEQVFLTVIGELLHIDA